MEYTYKTRGVCARNIRFELDGDIIKSVSFDGGCSGNTMGVAKLVVGLKVNDVIDKLKNIDCNGRGTSCPAQFAIALQKALDEQ